MLTIYPVKDLNYYLENTAADYYVNGKSLPGNWAGVAAKSLGLSGDIEIDDYTNVMEGFSPDRTKALVQNAGGIHVPAYDMTFSAPKSVSILWALDEKGEIKQTHEKAVKAALRFIEKESAFTRRNGKGKKTERLPGLLAALFTHFESRAEDMQLHTHCLILNAAQRNDLTWGTIESRQLYQWIMASGAIYRAELAQNLRELGISIEADGDSFKVAGVPEQLCRFYSKRTKEISKSLKELGATTSASAIGDHVKTYTRAKKADTPLGTLRKRWRKELNEFGFTHEKVSQIRNIEPQLESRICDADYAVSDLTATKSTFREQDIYHHLAKQAQLSGDRSENIHQHAKLALTSQLVIKLGIDPKGNQLYTTQEVIEIERRMISQAKDMSDTFHLAPDELTLDSAIEKKQKHCKYELSQEQIEGLRLACNSKQLAILQGSAGAGKSVSMEALRFAYEGIDQVVVGACIAKIAVDNLQTETGIPSRTIAKLIHDYEQGKKPLANADVLLIDEAGQVGCKQMLTLLTMAKASRTKIVLVGEDKQLDAIERGGVLSYLSRPEVIGTARIEKIQRQNTQWARQAVTDFRDGNAKAALDALSSHSLLNFSPSFEETIDSLVDKWKAYTEQSDKKAVVLAQRWKEVNALSERLRSIYQNRGLVQHQDIEFDCSVSSKSMSLPFSIGERVRFSKNDYRLGVSNGTLGTLKSLELINCQWQFRVELDSGQIISFGQDQYTDEFNRLPLVHAYAMTVYSSQGVTVDGDTFILYNQSMDRANCYVAGSRHKDNSHFFINKKDIDHLDLTTNEASTDIEKLGNLMSRVNKSELALDLVSSSQLAEIDQNKNVTEISI